MGRSVRSVWRGRLAESSSPFWRQKKVFFLRDKSGGEESGSVGRSSSPSLFFADVNESPWSEEKEGEHVWKEGEIDTGVQGQEFESDGDGKEESGRDDNRFSWLHF